MADQSQRRRFPTRAELLGLDAKKVNKTKKEKRKFEDAQAASLVKRLHVVGQRIRKTNEVLNRHKKRKDMLLDELRPICQHDDIEFGDDGQYCKICETII